MAHFQRLRRRQLIHIPGSRNSTTSARYRPLQIARDTGESPWFVMVNHVAADLKTPRKSASRRRGITRESFKMAI